MPGYSENDPEVVPVQLDLLNLDTLYGIALPLYDIVH
jgi:hypothetical protein